MIKFWKSAAKGKSGCPVRPPEKVSKSSNAVDSSISSDLNFNCDSLKYQLELNGDEDIAYPTKSRLSKSLEDILSDEHSLNYFIQFMESISMLYLIKFWLDVEQFKKLALSCNQNGHRKISRTLSCRVEDKAMPSDEQKIHRRLSELCLSSSLNCEVNSNEKSDSNAIDDKCDNSVRDPTENKYMKAVIDEAIAIFKKYIALESPIKLELPDNVRNIVISNICQPGGLVRDDCFQIVQDIIFEKMKDYYEAFLGSPYHTKYQIDILTDGSLTLEDILFNEIALFNFMEFLERESCTVLLEFVMAVISFNENLVNNSEMDADQAQNDAIVLYDKYFSLQATNPIVGFPCDVRLSIEENICREGGPQSDCFHRPFRIVIRTLSKYLMLFVESELFYKFLSEMINSVHLMWNTVSGHRKTFSDSSSEISISTQNTLLAMGDLPFKKSKRKKPRMPDMTIDSNQLYNADSLWQRKRQDGLNLGRITSLGRFESKLEPDPDRKDPSTLKKVVSRLLPSSAANAEEEMAWQVAHMIVKDITDLTMAPQDGPIE